MTRIIVILFSAFLFSIEGLSQTSYITREGTISFYSFAPLEDITAVNNRVQAMLNSETGEIIVRLRIEDFRFRIALMQKHFNERFMESHIYPESRFTGIIEDLDKFWSEELPEEVTVKGSLTIHGVTREVEITGSLQRSGPYLICNATFPVRVADYDITIPRILIRNIAEIVEVTVNMRLEPVK